VVHEEKVRMLDGKERTTLRPSLKDIRQERDLIGSDSMPVVSKSDEEGKEK
jgi:hypothetical protein